MFFRVNHLKGLKIRYRRISWVRIPPLAPLNNLQSKNEIEKVR